MSHSDKPGMWRDPETEARIVAWVLGEASDFEIEALEKLVSEDRQLAAFVEEMRELHGQLGEVHTAPKEPWAIEAGARESLLKTLGAEAPQKSEKAAPYLLPKLRTVLGGGIAAAACVTAGMMVSKMRLGEEKDTLAQYSADPSSQKERSRWSDLDLRGEMTREFAEDQNLRGVEREASLSSSSSRLRNVKLQERISENDLESKDAMSLGTQFKSKEDSIEDLESRARYRRAISANFQKPSTVPVPVPVPEEKRPSVSLEKSTDFGGEAFGEKPVKKEALLTRNTKDGDHLYGYRRNRAKEIDEGEKAIPLVDNLPASGRFFVDPAAEPQQEVAAGESLGDVTNGRITDAKSKIIAGTATRLPSDKDSDFGSFQSGQLAGDLLVEGRDKESGQIELATKFTETSQAQNEELGFAWLREDVQRFGNGVDRAREIDFDGVPGASVSSGFAINAGDSAKSGDASVESDFTRLNRDFIVDTEGKKVEANENHWAFHDQRKKGQENVVTSGLRSGDFAVNRNSIDAVLNNPNRVSGQSEGSSVQSLAGVFPVTPATPTSFDSEEVDLFASVDERFDDFVAGGQFHGKKGLGLSTNSYAFWESFGEDPIAQGGKALDGSVGGLGGFDVNQNGSSQWSGASLSDLDGQRLRGGEFDGFLNYGIVGGRNGDGIKIVREFDDSLELRLPELADGHDSTREAVLYDFDSAWKLKALTDESLKQQVAKDASQRDGSGLLALKEKVKRPSKISDADGSLYFGRLAQKNQDYKKAIDHYKRALSLLPEGTETEDRRRSYAQHLVNAQSQFERFVEQKELEKIPQETSVAQEPFSTFSLHVSDVSFQLAQEAMEKGKRPAVEKVRQEEFYNAFDYGDVAPSAGEPVACAVEQSAHPMYQQRNLVRVGIKTGSVGRAEGKPLRLTVLLDHSGSMQREDRSKAVEQSLLALCRLLGEHDQVSLVGFARQPRLLIDRAKGNQVSQLVSTALSTPSEGGTNIEEALQVAAQQAKRQQDDGAINRIILLTDGGANLGNADGAALSKQIVALRQSGVAFDACGVGVDELNDALLTDLSKEGDGRYYVLSGKDGAGVEFAKKLAGAFRPAAENVKVQVKFNPDRVDSYRLIGFEKHLLKKQDFRNDKVDAAELAAEEAGQALYQVKVNDDGAGDVGQIFVRFRDASTGKMIEQNWPIRYQPKVATFDQATPSIQLAGTAAFLAEALKGESVDWSQIKPSLTKIRAAYPSVERVEQLQKMVETISR